MGGGLAAFVDEAAAARFAVEQGLTEAATYAWQELMELGAARPWVPLR